MTGRSGTGQSISTSTTELMRVLRKIPEEEDDKDDVVDERSFDECVFDHAAVDNAVISGRTPRRV